MFTWIKEFENQLNGLYPEQKIKHIDNIMNELKEQFMWYGDRKKIRDIKSNLAKLKNIRSSIKINNKPPIDPCVEPIIDGSVCRFMSDNESHSSETSDDEDIEVTYSSEKPSGYNKFLNYTALFHFDGVSDSKLFLVILMTKFKRYLCFNV